MMWKIDEKNFGTDYNSHIVHWEFKLVVGDGNCQFVQTEALKDQTAGASNCTLTLFKVIYISVKDLRMLL